MKKKTLITIDNGGSQIRYIGHNNEIEFMDKSIIQIDKDSFRIKDGVDKFDIIDIQEGNHEFTGMYARNAGYYMYSGTTLTFNSKKAESVAWYTQLLITIAIDAMKQKLRSIEISKLEQESIDMDVEIFEDFDYVVSVLIPVLEHSGKKDYCSMVKRKLAGHYKVYFPVLKDYVEFSLSEEKIGVLPEGTVALTAIGNDKLTRTTNTLIIDIGQVTTDISICKGRQLVGNASLSSSFAGSTLLSIISNNIRLDRNITPTDDMCIDALTKRKIKIGSIEIDVTAIVKDSINIFVTNYLKEEILQQLELARLTTSSIEYIIPIGGVLSVVDTDGKHDILDAIIDICGLNQSECINIVGTDLRNVNISCASKFTEHLAKHASN